MTDDTWVLPSDKRSRVVSRTGSSLYCLAFEAKKELSEDVANLTARKFEEKAYLTAQAQATTTTGTRPAKETTKIYLR